MIKVVVHKEQEQIQQIEIIGHADYDDIGKDIVCSSVSSIVITTVNAIEKINDQYLRVDEKTDKMILNVLQVDVICQKLIANMLELLMELSSQYPKNIIVK